MTLQYDKASASSNAVMVRTGSGAHLRVCSRPHPCIARAKFCIHSTCPQGGVIFTVLFCLQIIETLLHMASGLVEHCERRVWLAFTSWYGIG